MRRIITITLTALALSSCIFEDLSDCPNYNGKDSPQELTVPVEFSIRAYGDTTRTRSSIAATDNAVEDINLLAYYDGQLETSAYVESPETFTLNLFKDRAYSLYALANVGEIEAPQTEEEILDYRYSVNTITEIQGGFPMAWSEEEFTVSGTSPQVSISLERLVSRINLSIDSSELSDFKITAVKLCQGALGVYPFTDESKAASTSEVGDGDWASSSDLTSLNNGGTASFYALENCQGVLLPNNKSADSKIPSEIPDASSLCTYLEMTASFSGEYEGVDVSSDNVRYRFYIGKDNCTDFNVIRNNDVDINLTVTEDRIFDESWKVSYGEDLPSISYRLEMSQPSASLNVGGSTTLSAIYYRTVDGTRDSETNVTSYAAWTSSNTSVATVSNGKITAVAAGTATITATYYGYSATSSVTVEDKITYDYYLSPTSTSTVTGRTTKLTAVQRTFTNGVQTYGQDMSSSFTWASSDTSVATVGSNGVITGVSPGTATITATYGGTTLTGTVTVTPLYTYELSISPTTLSITKGASGMLIAAYKTYADGELQYSENVNSEASWTSSDTDIAVVSVGAVTAMEGGSVTITATYNGISATASVTVNATPELKLGWTSQTLERGDVITNAAIYYPNNENSPSVVTSSTTWTTSNSGVATVGGGTITAQGAGTAIITATYNGYSASCTVTVAEDTSNPANTYVSGMSLSSEWISGSSYKLMLTLSFSDGTKIEDVPYTWSISYAQSPDIDSSTTGEGPILYTGGGSTYVMAVVVTTSNYYYDASGNYRKHTTGTSFSHNTSWTP